MQATEKPSVEPTPPARRRIRWLTPAIVAVVVSILAVVLNFWASWCQACREEHPGFVAAWNRYRDKGVVFLGILYNDSPRAAEATMEELGGDWPNLLDPGSRTALRYGVYGVPETFFIGADGTVAYKHIGATPYATVLDQIQRLLSTGSRR
ncbi:MAG: TlpA family protein disulfide reductase [Actinomycetota bacterium]|nr:TlpA family protein disulfide reductase [Actinomycetota bacterium]